MADNDDSESWIVSFELFLDTLVKSAALVFCEELNGVDRIERIRTDKYGALCQLYVVYCILWVVKIVIQILVRTYGDQPFQKSWPEFDSGSA